MIASHNTSGNKQTPSSTIGIQSVVLFCLISVLISVFHFCALIDKK